MDKYKRLFSNTILFAVSNFSAKMLTLFLKPLYSRVLDDAEMGVYNNAWSYVVMLLPLICLGMDYAVLRFGLDKEYSRTRVFTNSVIGLLAGFAALVALLPAMRRLPNCEGYLTAMYAALLVSNLRRLCAQFVRAKNLLRLVAVDGILLSFLTVMFNLLFLLVFKTGAVGILWATVAADLCSLLFLWWMAALGRYWHPKKYSNPLMGRMLRYALPLIPSLMCWNITNSSDYLFVTHMLADGKRLAGLLGYSYVLAQAVQLAASIFNEAWQLSAITEQDDREEFFSRIFGIYQGVMFIGGAALLLLCRPFYHIYVKAASFEAWRYAPFLVLATVYSCFSGFLNSIYVAEKRSGLSLATAAVGAASNCVLNYFFILHFGVTGAALATFASHAIVFLMRAVNTRSLLAMDFSPPAMLANTGLLILQATLMINEVPLWPLWCGLCAAAVLALNLKNLWQMARQLLRRFGKRRRRG